MKQARFLIPGFLIVFYTFFAFSPLNAWAYVADCPTPCSEACGEHTGVDRCIISCDAGTELCYGWKPKAKDGDD